MTERRAFYTGLNAALAEKVMEPLVVPAWQDKLAGHELLARLPLVRVPLGSVGHAGGKEESMLLPIVPTPSDAELVEHIALVKEVREAHASTPRAASLSTRPSTACSSMRCRRACAALQPLWPLLPSPPHIQTHTWRERACPHRSARAAVEYMIIKTAGDGAARELAPPSPVAGVSPPRVRTAHKNAYLLWGKELGN